jgi:hypothetical protein
LSKFLEDIFFQGFVNASIDDQQMTKGTVIGPLSRYGDTKSIVKIDVVGLDRPRQWDSFDQQV